MGGFLWSAEAMPDPARARLSNAALLDAMRALAFIHLPRGGLRPVDWRHPGAVEPGSVCESLLELQPEVDGGSFELRERMGNDRRTTGSCYTPVQIIESLLTTSLDPVIAVAVRRDRPVEALLGLKVCDPACGSGHFLLAAANRLAKALASLRTGEAEPSPAALRGVVERCVYGIDINPMSL